MSKPNDAVRPKKALGQHFLKDESIAHRIADTLADFRALPVIEVGPGMGVLTKYLLADGYDLKVAEIDGESIDYLRTHFPELDGRIIDGDFLQLNLNDVFPGDGDFCVIGNYPYNISSQIFFHVLEYKDRVACCSGMLQREVAERLAAPPGTKARGILSVLLQAWYDVEYLFTVSEQVFNPPPKVKSGVIRMTRRKDVTALGCDERRFKTVVKTAFGQRRKTLRNSLKPLLPPGFDLSDPLLALRPEQLTVAQFVALTNALSL
ncbi:MAG: 16S rRNA (adenine(1518)-N(6)/adenine(1519)-N(6))-dimethyltransferase RsmA [Muribaculaceae bacterium]|nr:16S rRNA (adenine(1518)-N(6)/adenine(1519)-N(6))-dimethyltransferase RsmA [Muribaculaceae bacterium]